MRIAGLSVLLTTGFSPAAGQNPANLEQTPGKDLRVDLAPGQSKAFSMRLEAGTAALLTAEQTSGTVEVVWAREPGTPRTNPAGLQSKISILMIANATETEEISLRALSKTKPVTVTLHIDGAHPATDADRQEAAAETALADAENIRLQRKTSNYESALAYYDQAASIWQAAGDNAQLARTLTWKALFLFVNKADAAAALPVIQAARTHVSALSPVEAANCLKVSGYVNVQLAHYDDGRAAYQQAIRIFATTGDLYNQEVLLDNLSRVDRLLGDTDRALADAQQAESLAGRIGDVTRQLKIKAELGAIQISASNLEAAYAEYRSSLALLKDHPDPTTEAYVWSDLGVLYTQLHQPKQAADALDRAMQLWKQNPNPVGEINTLDDFGELWMTQAKLPLARSYYERGLSVAKEKELTRDQVYLLRGLGATYLLENNLTEAQANLDHALELALRITEGDGLPEIYCLTGDLHVRRHEDAAAEAAYAQCRKTAADAKDTASLIRADGSVARLDFEDGKTDEASERIEQALSAIEQARSAIPEQDLRTSFFASMRSYFALGVDIFERLDKLHPGEGYQWQAFLVAERARSRMLLDQVRSQAAGQPGPPPALLAESAAVETQLRRSEAELARGSPRHSVRINALKASILRLRLEDHALSAEIDAERSAGPDLPHVPLSIASLGADLPRSRSLLLEYWTGEHASYLWAISPTGLKSYRMAPATTLDEKVKALTHLLFAAANTDPTLSAEERARRRPEETRHLSAARETLRKMIFPAGALPQATKTLLVVADGPLLTVPFAALTQSRSMEILSEPSATFLDELMRRPAPRADEMRIAVFADPMATPGDSSPQPARLRPGSEAAAAIPYTLEEAASIRSIFGPAHTQILSGTHASPAAIMALDWSPYAVAHFASHATLNRESLELTGLLLGPAKAETASADADVLWYSEVCRLHVPLALVVLSACDTANGEAVPGEGLVGLTQAFFVAGAQRVLGSLWPADDEATSILMKHFYTALRTSHSPSFALRAAQARMAEDARWSSPYYWAGFSLSGDWRTMP